MAGRRRTQTAEQRNLAVVWQTVTRRAARLYAARASLGEAYRRDLAAAMRAVDARYTDPAGAGASPAGGGGATAFVGAGSGFGSSDRNGAGAE